MSTERPASPKTKYAGIGSRETPDEGYFRDDLVDFFSICLTRNS